MTDVSRDVAGFNVYTNGTLGFWLCSPHTYRQMIEAFLPNGEFSDPSPGGMEGHIFNQLDVEND